MLTKHPSFSSAFYTTLQRLYDQPDWEDGVLSPESIASGKRFKELRGDGFVLTNPIDRVPSQPSRAFGPRNAVAITTYMLAGFDRVAPIAHYNTRANGLADDGTYMLGAHGARMREQLLVAERLLRADRTTRRAMVTVYSGEDILRQIKDVPCVATLQFLIRNEALDLLVHMRSQSACMVMPYDVFAFTVLQELMANSLGVELGLYYHMCNSLHVFENEMAMVTKILEDGVPKTHPQAYYTYSTTLTVEMADARNGYHDVITNTVNAYFTGQEARAEGVLPQPGLPHSGEGNLSAPSGGSRDNDSR